MQDLDNIINKTVDPDEPCVEGGLSHCSKCSEPLCLRKQTINLALNHVEEMFCLTCLGEHYGRKPEDVLLSVKPYIQSRPCFDKEWMRYRDESACPQPKTCFLASCFAED